MKATKKTNPQQCPLVGKWFHSLAEDTGKVKWQGTVLGKTESGLYLIQLFSWLCGEPTNQCLIKGEEMEHWLFYDNADQMNHSYYHGTAKPGSQYQDEYPKC